MIALPLSTACVVCDQFSLSRVLSMNMEQTLSPSITPL